MRQILIAVLIAVLCISCSKSKSRNEIVVLGQALDMDADTDQTGAVDGSPFEEAEELTPPGLIILPNLNDNDAVSADSMVPDASNDFIDGGTDFDDISTIIVRRIADLATGDEIAVLVPAADAANIRIFPEISGGTTAIIDSTHGSLVTIASIDYREAILDFNTIRARDFMLGIEGVVPGGGATVIVSRRDASTKTEHESDSLLVSVAPIMMLSNLEGTERVLVSNGDSVFAAAISNAVQQATGQSVTVMIPFDPFDGDVWVQDEFQVLYAIRPARMMPMIQDSPRDGPLDTEVEPVCFQYNYAHMVEGTSTESPDFGGNTEVSPPVPAYHAGVIYSSTELSTELQTFYRSQGLQTLDTGQLLLLDASWLAVGHIDEYVGFIPMPATPDTTDFRLLVASPAVAKAILDDLAAGGNGAAPVFSGTGNETTVSDLLANSARWTYNDACQTDCDNGRDLMISSLGLIDCITRPVAGGANTGSGALARAVMMWAYHTMGANAQWRITFTSGTAFNFEYDSGGGWVGDGTGDRSTDSLSASKAVAIPSNYWSGTPQAGDIFTFATTTNSQVVDLPVFFHDFFGYGALGENPDVVNLQVVSGHLLVCKAFGPDVTGQDQFEVFMSNALSHTGCTIHYIDDWEHYHDMMGEIHCGTEVIRIPRPDFRWWEQ